MEFMGTEETIIGREGGLEALKTGATCWRIFWGRIWGLIRGKPGELG